ncbi:MAG: hypothetical protein ABIJ09_12170 [Pseudomonadota bacterium]
MASWSFHRIRTARIWWILAPVALWLGWTAWSLDVEYYDGFEALCNARAMLGQDADYNPIRAPLMALLQLPAVWLHGTWQLHPLDVRLPHALMAFLHLGALALVLRQIVRHIEDPAARWVAALGAVLTPLWASYAPFISHDILPGALFLFLLHGAERERRRPSPWNLLLLVVVGAALPLIKHVYALCWVVVLVGVALVRDGGAAGNLRPGRLLTRLLLAALGSALFTLVVMGAALGDSLGEAPLLLRPLLQVQAIRQGYADAGMVFPWWVYLRNLPAQGWLVALLLVPALVIGWREKGAGRRLAVAWVGFFVGLQAMPGREVRYLLVLAPLTAMLLARVWPLVRRWRGLQAALVLVLAWSAIETTTAAAQFRDPFYLHSSYRTLLQPLEARQPGTRTVLAFHQLSLPPAMPSPWAGDRGSYLFHLSPEHVRVLYGIPARQVLHLPPQELSASAGTLVDGDLIIFSNTVLINDLGFWPSPPPELSQEPGFHQWLARRRSSASAADARTPSGFELLSWCDATGCSRRQP